MAGPPQHRLLSLWWSSLSLDCRRPSSTHRAPLVGNREARRLANARRMPDLCDDIKFERGPVACRCGFESDRAAGAGNWAVCNSRNTVYEIASYAVTPGVRWSGEANVHVAFIAGVECNRYPCRLVRYSCGTTNAVNMLSAAL